MDLMIFFNSRALEGITNDILAVSFKQLKLSPLVVFRHLTKSNFVLVRGHLIFGSKGMLFLFGPDHKKKEKLGYLAVKRPTRVHLSVPEE